MRSTTKIGRWPSVPLSERTGRRRKCRPVPGLCAGAARKAIISAIAAFAFACPTLAVGQADSFSCWDHTFAYTTAGIQWDGTSAEVRFKTQDRTLLRPLTNDLGDWGPIEISILYPASACKVDRLSPAFSCEGKVREVVLRRTSPLGDEIKDVPLTANFAAVELAVTDGAALNAKDHEGHYRVFNITLRDVQSNEVVIGPYHWNADCSGWPVLFPPEP